MKKTKLILIIISPLLFSLILSLPIIIKSYHNYLEKSKYTQFKELLTKKQNELKSLINTEKETENQLEKEYYIINENLDLEEQIDTITKEIDDINSLIIDYQRNIKTQQRSIDNINKYLNN